MLRPDMMRYEKEAVLLHELLHAYHARLLPDGYANKGVIGLFRLCQVQGSAAQGILCAEESHGVLCRDRQHLPGREERIPRSRSRAKRSRRRCRTTTNIWSACSASTPTRRPHERAGRLAEVTQTPLPAPRPQGAARTCAAFCFVDWKLRMTPGRELPRRGPICIVPPASIPFSKRIEQHGGRRPGCRDPATGRDSCIRA